MKTDTYSQAHHHNQGWPEAVDVELISSKEECLLGASKMTSGTEYMCVVIRTEPGSARRSCVFITWISKHKGRFTMIPHSVPYAVSHCEAMKNASNRAKLRTLALRLNEEVRSHVWEPLDLTQHLHHRVILTTNK